MGMRLGKRRMLTALLIITISFCLLLCTTNCYASTGHYSKSFSNIVGVESAGWVTINTTLDTWLTYTQSTNYRYFSQEEYSLVATSINSPTITNRLTVSMGVLQMYSPAVVYNCYQSGPQNAYYSDPSWVAHYVIWSNKQLSFQRNNGAYCKLGYSIDGGINYPSGVATWSGIA